MLAEALLSQLAEGRVLMPVGEAARGLQRENIVHQAVSGVVRGRGRGRPAGCRRVHRQPAGRSSTPRSLKQLTHLPAPHPRLVQDVRLLQLSFGLMMRTAPGQRGCITMHHRLVSVAAELLCASMRVSGWDLGALAWCCRAGLQAGALGAVQRSHDA